MFDILIRFKTWISNSNNDSNQSKYDYLCMNDKTLEGFDAKKSLNAVSTSLLEWNCILALEKCSDGWKMVVDEWVIKRI